jgi:hypothetical protein
VSDTRQIESRDGEVARQTLSRTDPDDGLFMTKRTQWDLPLLMVFTLASPSGAIQTCPAEVYGNRKIRGSISAALFWRAAN